MTKEKVSLKAKIIMILCALFMPVFLILPLIMYG